MKKSGIVIFFLTTVMLSCGRSNAGFMEIKDRDMTVQLLPLKNDDNAEMSSFKIRVTPDRAFAGMKNIAKNQLWYHMDSCFYLLSGATKIYPQVTQPVANGVKDSYEYLVGFEKNGSTAASDRLIYQDMYLNKKTYSFNFLQ